jgi:ATP-binding cassette subfamily B (MDR/TAP) protein 1
MSDVAQAFAAANRIRSMRPVPKVENQTTLFDDTELETGEKVPHGVKIEFKDVFFRYPTRDVPVLNGLNMTVRLIYDSLHSSC